MRKIIIQLYQYLTSLSSKTKWVIAMCFAFILGLVMSVYVYNYVERSRENYLEVTWLSHSEAVIFWKTETPTVGYLKHGESRLLGQEAYQTSSEPSTIHVVILENITGKDHYISIHTQSDSPLLWSDPKKIQYQESEL